MLQNNPEASARSASLPPLVLVIALICTVLSLDALAEDVLVKDGKAQCVIVIPEGTDGRVLENSACRVLKAAHALAGYLKTMSGAHVPVRWDIDDCPGFRIYIGSTQLEPVDPAAITQGKIGFDGFIIKSVPDGVVIAGRTPLGTEHAVYHFAEEVLGIHWYSAEDNGPTIPRRATVSIPRLALTVKPDFAWRGQYYSIITNYLTDDIKANRDAWWTFNRLWGISGLMAHIYSGFVPNSLFDSHPEYFALIDGKRTRGDINVQRCLSNPDVLQLAIDFSAGQFEKYPDLRLTSLSGNDGGGWCECEKCKAMGPTQTHRTFAFANAVAEALEDRYPNRGFCVLAYQKTIEPPMDMKIHRNVAPFIAPMSHCRVHPIMSACSHAIDKRKIFSGWGELCGRFFWYPYLNGGPFTGPGVITMAEEMRFARDQGCQGGFREHTAGPQANWAMLNWMEVKLQWDVDLDPVKLRRQFIEGYYGQAAADEVERAYDAVENQLRNIPIADRPGVPYGHNNMNSKYLDPLLAACGKQINGAIRAAEREPDARFRRRIARDMGALKGELPEDLKGLLDE